MLSDMLDISVPDQVQESSPWLLCTLLKEADLRTDLPTWSDLAHFTASSSTMKCNDALGGTEGGEPAEP